MGYMTNISILNDGWDVIKKNPKQFIEEIENGMYPRSSKTVTYHPVQTFSSPIIVSRSMHADIPQLMLSHCNSMIALHMPHDHFDTLHNFSFLQSSIQTAQQVLNYAKQEIEDKACLEILRDIKSQGKDVDKMTDKEIIEAAKTNAWAKEISWQVNFAKRIRKNANLLSNKL